MVRISSGDSGCGRRPAARMRSSFSSGLHEWRRWTPTSRCTNGARQQRRERRTPRGQRDALGVVLRRGAWARSRRTRRSKRRSRRSPTDESRRCCSPTARRPSDCSQRGERRRRASLRRQMPLSSPIGGDADLDGRQKARRLGLGQMLQPAAASAVIAGLGERASTPERGEQRDLRDERARPLRMSSKQRR